MSRFLRNLLQTAAGTMGGSLSSRTYRLEKRGFEADARNIRGDFAVIGKDMRKALKLEQQANYRAR